MKPIRRLMVSIGAPLILVVGLGVAWGVRKGSAMVHQLEDWGDAWEHSSEPVDMHVADFPVISNMYVDGEKVGTLENIVLLRQAPRELDSVRIVVRVPHQDHVAHLSDCQLKMDPGAMEGAFPLEGWKHLMNCVSDTEGLVEFGSVVLEGLDRELSLLLEREDLPCDHMHDSELCGDLDGLREEMQRLGEEIRREVRKNVRVRVR
jgi:hypothetical protein